MRKLAIIMLAICFSTTLLTAVTAQEAKGKAQRAKGQEKAAAVKPQMEELQVSGRISKVETTRKGKDGAEQQITRYVLTTAAGDKITLPAPKGKVAETINIDSLLDMPVTVTGQGMKKTVKAKDGVEKEQLNIRIITKIEGAGEDTAAEVEAAE